MSYKLIHLNKVDSTNLEAKRMIKNHKNIDQVVIYADTQFQGKGRNQKIWLSPYGNLYCSIILKAPLPSPYYRYFNFVAGLAVHKTISTLLKTTTNTLFIKWPNDIILNDSKLAGILIESISDYLIIGIGVNIRETPSIAGKKTIALADIGIIIDILSILKIVVNDLDNYKNLIIQKGFSPIRKLWIPLSYYYQQEISINTIKGTFVNIDNLGRLVLENKAGKYFFEDGSLDV